MARFKVVVTSEQPQETREALDRAGIPSIGPAFAYWRANAVGGSFSDTMTAVFDAADADAAEARVRAAVGPKPTLVTMPLVAD